MAKKSLKKLKMTSSQQLEGLRTIFNASRLVTEKGKLIQKILDELEVPFDFLKIEFDQERVEKSRKTGQDLPAEIGSVSVFSFPYGSGTLTVGHSIETTIDKPLSRWLEDVAALLALLLNSNHPAPQPPNEELEAELQELRGRLHTALEQTQRELEATKQSSREEVERVKQETASQLEQIQNQTQEVINENRLWDELTLLPNAKLFPLMMSPMLAHARRSTDVTAILFLEIERIEEMLKLHGLDSPDRIIKPALERMMRNLREGDIAVHGGQNRILWCLGGLHSLENTATVAEKMLLSLSRPLEVDGKPLTLSGSIGISLFPADGPDPETLMKHASNALEVARKTPGNSIRFFSKEMNEKVRNYLVSRKELKDATTKQEFTLHYQPVVRFSSNEVESLEALIRWRKPQGQTIYPANFLGLSHQIGILSQLDEWMMKTACLQRGQWEKEGFGAFRVSVNLSHEFFWEGGLEKVASILKETSTPPDKLDLEIAETLLSSNVDAAADRLKKYFEIGVNLTIDDFGSTGGLMNLVRYPVHAIKLFPAFSRGIVQDSSNAAVVSSAVSLAHNLKIRVVAKAIETQAERSLLESLGCDSYQGNLFSPALPKSLLTEFLRKEQMKAATVYTEAVEKTQPMEVEQEPVPVISVPSERKRSGPAYLISCFSCNHKFNAIEADWCQCITPDPSVLCPLCKKCFCRATLDYRHQMWGNAPESFWDRKRQYEKEADPIGENPLPGDVKRPLILVVDDEIMVARIACSLLRKLGYSVIAGLNGEQGLQLARTYKPDLVISDALMPKMDGRDMCAMLKKDPETSGVKTIIMTSFTGASKYKSSAIRDYQFDEQLQKPVEYEKLRTVLQKFLGS